MIDTNPFANNTQAQPVSNGGQSPQSTTYPGAIANMIKAIMQGNDQYKQSQAQAQGQNPLAMSSGSAIPGADGPTSVGGPQGPTPLQPGMSPAPLTSPDSMTPSLGASSAFTGGASPVSMDPVTQALMSPIPGM